MKKIFLIAAAYLVLFIGCSSEHSNDKHTETTEYYCPMHPEVTSDKPGICPICQMDLVVRESEMAEMENTEGLIKLGERKQIVANVSTVKVKQQRLTKEIKSASYIDFAEPNKKIISAKFNGRIEKLFVNKTGDYIKKGDALFEYYSPEIIQAQNDFLLSIKSNDVASLKEISNNENKFSVSDAAVNKLKLYGFTDIQLNELKTTKQINYNPVYYSPFGGTVIEKKIQDGVYFSEGTSLFEIADLSTVWNIVEVFEDDAVHIKNGSQVKLILPSQPGVELTGRVTFIYPVINPETRTVKIRTEFANTSNRLKPNMFGETVFSIDAGTNIIVPQSAVLLTGSRNIVWLKVSENTFEPKEVSLGIKMKDHYEIKTGLKENDEVVVSGGYLIDSESQLKTGMQTGHNHNTTTSDVNTEMKKPVVKEPEMDITDHSSHSSNEKKLTETQEIFNAVCPILGGKVSPKVKPVEYKGKLIGFCCPGCDKDFLENPELYMKNLSSDGKKFLGEIE